MSDDSLRIVKEVETEREGDGRCLAEVLELPDVLAYGENEDAAVSHVQTLPLRIIYATNADAARTADTNLRAHVGQTLPGRGDESVGRRRRTAYVLHLSESALENLANHEHD